MSTEQSTELGLEVAWFEDKPDTIASVRSYLEDRNFVIHQNDDPDEIEEWVVGNGYDVLLSDLDCHGGRDGAHLIDGIRGSSKSIPIIPVSAYLGIYEKSLKEMSEDIFNCAIDKATLDTSKGIEDMRHRILEQTNGGRIRVIERCVGFVEEEDNKNLIVYIELPDKSVQKRAFPKEQMNGMIVGTPSLFLEITTVHRRRANGLVLETICKWLAEPT